MVKKSIRHHYRRRGYVIAGVCLSVSEMTLKAKNGLSGL